MAQHTPGARLNSVPLLFKFLAMKVRVVATNRPTENNAATQDEICSDGLSALQFFQRGAFVQSDVAVLSLLISYCSLSSLFRFAYLESTCLYGEAEAAPPAKSYTFTLPDESLYTYVMTLLKTGPMIELMRAP